MQDASSTRKAVRSTRWGPSDLTPSAPMLFQSKISTRIDVICARLGPEIGCRWPQLCWSRGQALGWPIVLTGRAHCFGTTGTNVVTPEVKPLDGGEVRQTGPQAFGTIGTETIEA